MSYGMETIGLEGRSPVGQRRRGASEPVVEAQADNLRRQISRRASRIVVIGKLGATDGLRRVYGDIAEIQIEVFRAQRPVAAQRPLRAGALAARA